MQDLLVSLGLCWILMYGRPTKFIRKLWKDLFECSLCTGFWTGFLLRLLNGFSFKESFLFALSSAAFCWFFTTVILLLQGLDKIYIIPFLEKERPLKDAHKEV